MGPRSHFSAPICQTCPSWLRTGQKSLRIADAGFDVTVKHVSVDVLSIFT